MKKFLLLAMSTTFLASCGSQAPVTESQQAAKNNMSELCYDHSSAYNEYG
jgi:hypothetical protein